MPRGDSASLDWEGGCQKILLLATGLRNLSATLSDETITAIMMLYKNLKAMVYSPDGNTIVAGVLPGDALVPFLFMI